MTRQEMPIFTRITELLAWLVPVTEHFPRTQRCCGRSPTAPLLPPPLWPISDRATYTYPLW